MKRLIWILPLVLLLTLLAGCEVDMNGTENALPDETYYPVTGYWSGSEGADPNAPQEKNVVKTVLSYENELPFSVQTVTCSYRLPFIDLPGAEAAACNQELEARYGTLIRQSMDAIEKYQDPVLQTLSFTSYTLESVLTLRVERVDMDGDRSVVYYTVDASSGDAVSLEALFAAAKLSGKPQVLVDQAVQKLFTKRFGPLDPDDTAYTTALNRTQSAASPVDVSRMHLTEDGRLALTVELFVPNGGSSFEELILP